MRGVRAGRRVGVPAVYSPGLSAVDGSSAAGVVLALDGRCDDRRCRVASGRSDGVGLCPWGFRGVSDKVADAGLVHLGGLSQLGWLSLSDTKVAGPEMKHLAGLGQLQEFYLSRTPLTDAGLAYLAALT